MLKFRDIKIPKTKQLMTVRCLYKSEVLLFHSAHLPLLA